MQSNLLHSKRFLIFCDFMNVDPETLVNDSSSNALEQYCVWIHGLLPEFYRAIKIKDGVFRRLIDDRHEQFDKWLEKEYPCNQ